jgi:hypothetical protein
VQKVAEVKNGRMERQTRQQGQGGSHLEIWNSPRNRTPKQKRKRPLKGAAWIPFTAKGEHRELELEVDKREKREMKQFPNAGKQRRSLSSGSDAMGWLDWSKQYEEDQGHESIKT